MSVKELLLKGVTITSPYEKAPWEKQSTISIHYNGQNIVIYGGPYSTGEQRAFEPIEVDGALHIFNNLAFSKPYVK